MTRRQYQDGTMIAVDTNVLLRYLLEPLDQRNPQWQVSLARQVINKEEQVLVSDIVLAELEWVLVSVFELTRANIAHIFRSLAGNIRFCFDDWSTLQAALIDYQENENLDLSDCLIARRAHNQGAVTLYTFEGENKLGALPIATTLRSEG